MKINNWCKKLSSTLVVGGLLAPIAATAAPTNSNLVVNGDFENVDLATTSFYSAPNILDWGGSVPGFAYSHNLSGASVPDFANGGPLSGGGDWYFTPGNGGNDSLANALVQNIDVSGGATMTAIAGGGAAYNLSAFFSTYAGQQDRAVVRATFLSVAAVVLGSAEIATPPSTNLTTWQKFSNSGVIPVGTTLISVASWGIAATGSADGYTDNVSFIINPVPEPATAMLAGLGLGALALRRRHQES